MRRLFFAIVILCPYLARAQKLVAPADVPAVEALIASPLKPLKCFVVSRSNRIADGFRVEAAFRTVIPLNQYLPDADPKWTTIIRVEPAGKPGKAVYLTDSFVTDSEQANADDFFPRPADDSGISGPVLRYRGHFWTGAGKFVVYWIVLDNQGRGCRTKWRFSASSAAGRLRLSLPANTVAEASVRGLVQGAGEPRSLPGASRLTVLLDVTPSTIFRQNALPTTLGSASTLSLLSELTDVVRRIPSLSVRLICFSLDRQRVVYRDEDFHSESLDSLQRLNDAITRVNFGTVGYGVLSKPYGHLVVLEQLVTAEINASPPSAAVIFLGYQERFHDKLRPDAVPAAASHPKFFYVRPESPLLVDDESVTLAVKALKGTIFPYTVPSELDRAIERIKEAIAPKAP